MRLRVASYNVHRCIGTDGVERPERIAAVLRGLDADVIALQEVASLSGAGGDVLALFSAATGAAAIPGFTFLDKQAHYGNVLLSRLPVSNVRRVDISVPGREPRGVIVATVETGNRAVGVMATHLGLTRHERRFQAGRIRKLLERPAAEIHILIGDFNEWAPWGQSLRWLNRRFPSMPAPATFPSRRPVLRLDRIWVHPPDRVISVLAPSTTLTRSASDHLPLVADVDTAGGL